MSIPPAVEDLLTKGEEVSLVLDDCQLWDEDFTIYLTNKKIIFHRQEGLILKKDKVYTIPLNQVEGAWYEEKGLISKTGRLVIKARGRKWVITGRPEDVKALYREVG